MTTVQNAYIQGQTDALTKVAGMFTDDKGNLTTGSKVGLGALGVGAAGLLGYHLGTDGVKDAADFIGPPEKFIPPSIIDPATGMPEGVTKGLFGHISDAKDAAVDTGKGMAMAAGETYDQAKNYAGDLIKGVANEGKQVPGTIGHLLHGNRNEWEQAQEHLRNVRALRNLK